MSEQTVIGALVSALKGLRSCSGEWGPPCWCGVSVGLGENHSDYCDEAQRALARAEAAGASVPQEAAAIIAQIQGTLRPFINHRGDCTYGQFNPDGDYCTCGVRDAITRANKLAERLTGEASSAPQGTAIVQPPATVTRLEVIDHRMPDGMLGVDTGRVYSARNCAVELSYQDDGRTLKVFIDGTRA